jgi:hypothetical protein
MISPGTTYPNLFFIDSIKNFKNLIFVTVGLLHRIWQEKYASLASTTTSELINFQNYKIDIKTNHQNYTAKSM